MPSNIEIKAVLNNRAAAEAIAVRLSDTPAQIIEQEDTFFRCDGARLKLRILGADRCELIATRDRMKLTLAALNTRLPAHPIRKSWAPSR